MLLADGDAGTPGLVSSALASHCEMVGTVYDGQAAIAATMGLRPDILLLDVILPVLNGFEVIRRLVALNSTTKMIILTAVEDPEYVTEALETGANGFVFKRKTRLDLALAIREALSGRTFVSATQPY